MKFVVKLKFGNTEKNADGAAEPQPVKANPAQTGAVAKKKGENERDHAIADDDQVEPQPHPKGPGQA
jgi:hypothetical protein